MMGYLIYKLENVEHYGGEPEQADTACPPAKLKLMGARRRLLCPLCSLHVPWYWGVRGRLVCLHVVCLMERFQGKACQWTVATYA